jgi:hypothetical protein
MQDHIPEAEQLSEEPYKIYFIRGHRVMLDQDLAVLYEVPTKRLNEQVHRNASRFPLDFAFQLTNQEFMALRSQFATAKNGRGGRTNLLWVFTEHGVAMLSSVLNSERAIQANIEIMRSFNRSRLVQTSYFELKNRLGELEAKSEVRFKAVFDAIRELIIERSVPRKSIKGLSDKK